jgi:glycolate oxidase FAD binding subunit
MQEIVAQFQERIRDAVQRKAPLRIRAGGSKDFYGAALAGEILDMRAYTGVIEYEPRELVITVRAGTPLAEIEQVLAGDAQMLPFEPPHFGDGATIGGTVASGLSGPRRAYAGAVRDFVLGARILDGQGQDLRFGGRVIKNVAGYDVSRLMAGAFGTLGVLLDLSFKVLPRPVAETTLRFELSEADAIETMNRWAGQPLPLSATSWHDGALMVRLSGAAAGVAAARKKLGGDEWIEDAVGDAQNYWNTLREQGAAFFQNAKVLWRLSVPSVAPPLALGSSQWIEWGGALRWLAAAADAASLRDKIAACGGHATLFRAADKTASVFHPLGAGLAKIHQKLKQTFDPAGILNPGRMDNY